jgi:hypothetical protein
MGARDFLAGYRAKITALPSPEGGISAYLEGLNREEGVVLTTLLPAAAAIKHRGPELSSREILGEVKSWCLEELDRVL